MVQIEEISELKRAYLAIESAARRFGLHVPDEDLQLYFVPSMQMSVPYARGNFVERYAHWSFGKRAEQYWSAQYAAQAPQEVFIPTVPPRAFLVRSYTFSKKVAAFARVMAYQDFCSRNNLWLLRDFSEIWQGMHEHARFVAGLIANPNVDSPLVEETLTIAHALAPQCGHSSVLEGRSDDLLEKLALNDKLQSWQQELLLMVHTEWAWSLPYLETTIMMAGWSNFWQMRLLRAAGVDSGVLGDCAMEYVNNLAIPQMGQLNPRLVGSRIFENIHETSPRYPQGIFEAISESNDSSFIARYLTQTSAMECGLFSWGQDIEDEESLIVKELSDEAGWKEVRDALARIVGGNIFPAIRVADIQQDEKNQGILLQHQYDGRALDKKEALGTMQRVSELLGVSVHLEVFSPDEDGGIKSEIWQVGAN